MKNKSTFGTLYIVSTPIGNDDDITVRAIHTLQNCDLVVCEEMKEGARRLHKLNLDKKLDSLNEQNERDKTPEYISFLKEGKTIALISDDGTPVFADPGFLLMKAAMEADIKIVVVPGVTSLMAALVRSGFTLRQFLYAGFLSRKTEERYVDLQKLSNERKTVVVFETPYRLLPFLEDCVEIMPERRAYIGCNLTMPFETHHYGTFKDLYARFQSLGFKGEFVIVFEGNFGTIHRERRPDSISQERGASDRPRQSRDSSYRPAYKKRDDSEGGETRSDRPERSERSGGYNRERRPDGERSGGFNRERRPDGERSGGFNRERRPDGERSGGFNRERRPDGERSGGFNRERRPDGERPGGFNRERRPDGERSGGFNRERRPDGERSGGYNRERRPDGERSGGYNRERRPDGERSGGFNRERRPDGERPASSRTGSRDASRGGGFRGAGRTGKPFKKRDNSGDTPKPQRDTE
ncbi:MAG: 16S rRNA (cytidine(1402)-2'-O)-methyltransferase [Candidatus Kapabacteria bacterium]|nr:16S rRNA (cytidine(1402)-2'-O)-methyltransferase [Candidatus Kapabacteria bacterium]